jgi:5-methylcytosine-specific restriction enzyme subunit McrC
MEVAYDLGSFHFLDGLTGTESLRDLYRRLAAALARGVLARSQQGFYRAYVDQQQRLPYLRGRVDVRQGMRQPAQPAIACRYQEATGDVLHNQILAWTLHTIACSGICNDDGTSAGDGTSSGDSAQALVRRAYRRLDGVTSLRPLPASACDHVTYQRLNDDYRPLHALCRFFLEQAGPAHHAGDHEMLPFLLNMARLFERYVAQWLRAHLPAPWSLSVQEQVPLGEPSAAMAFYPDLVLYDGEGQARVVVDTKYRMAAIPDTAEVAQVLAYAQSKGCAEAVLVYPHVPATPFEAHVGGVRVRALSFALDGELEEAGVALQNAILQHHSHRRKTR